MRSLPTVTLISPTQIANANEVKLPQSKAVSAAVDKDVAKLRGIAKRHAKQHETVVAISLPWEKLAGIIQHWGQASKYAWKKLGSRVTPLYLHSDLLTRARKSPISACARSRPSVRETGS